MDIMDQKVLQEARSVISGFLKNRREELNLTQQQLADCSGIGIATIKRFESGRYWINMKQYLVLCFHLNCYPFVSPGKEYNTFHHPRTVYRR